MLQGLANYYWAHPVAITAGIITGILVLIWMSGSGSRQRFVVMKRTKETEQMARDLSRIASSLERIAKSYEMPTDYVGRPIPPGYEDTIVTNHANADEAPTTPVAPGTSAKDNAPATSEQPAAGKTANPLGETASLLSGKKTLNLPNPFYRPK
jgi:hypothetical protein